MAQDIYDGGNVNRLGVIRLFSFSSLLECELKVDDSFTKGLVK